jgi:hypothetical protein
MGDEMKGLLWKIERSRLEEYSTERI